MAKRVRSLQEAKTAFISLRSNVVRPPRGNEDVMKEAQDHCRIQILYCLCISASTALSCPMHRNQSEQDGTAVIGSTLAIKEREMKFSQVVASVDFMRLLSAMLCL